MQLQDVLRNIDKYDGHEITVKGFVHRTIAQRAQWSFFLADRIFEDYNFSPNNWLLVRWKSIERGDVDRRKLFQQLQELLYENISLSRYSIRDHLQLLQTRYGFRRLVNIFEKDDISLLFIENPFVDAVIENKALELIRELSYQEPTLSYHEIAAKTKRDCPFKVWQEGEITGILRQTEHYLVLSDVWKGVFPTKNSVVHVVIGDTLSYLDHFNGADCVQLREVLLEPEKFYGQQITLRGLFTNDIVEFENGIAYARLVPNRLYYEYRSKRDNRVSVHLRPSNITRTLESFYDILIGEDPQTRANHSTAEVRLTGILYPPENEYSSMIFDDITDMVSIHDNLIHHWNPEVLEHGLKYDY